jgi:hypothetical protein
MSDAARNVNLDTDSLLVRSGALHLVCCLEEDAPASFILV